MTDQISGVISFIGMGSNLDNPAARCLQAMEYMVAIEGCKVLRLSSFYRTEPVGYPDQDWFINAVTEIKTTLTPRCLMQELQAVERKMGRQKAVKWGPRIIDLDILFYGQEVIQDDDLIVPHRELHKRRFVMEPLHEIAHYFIHPAFGISIAGLMVRLEDKSRVDLLREG